MVFEVGVFKLSTRVQELLALKLVEKDQVHVPHQYLDLHYLLNITYNVSWKVFTIMTISIIFVFIKKSLIVRQRFYEKLKLISITIWRLYTQV